MRLILSILLSFVGTLVGSGVRSAINLAERQLEHAGPPGDVNINGSLVGGVAAGVVADAIGGPRLGFWLGAVFGAAGADRLDWWILRRAGLDPEKLMARARDAAMSQARAHGLVDEDEDPKQADAS
jgi:predicted membrane-bound spermidine synthase